MDVKISKEELQQTMLIMHREMNIRIENMNIMHKQMNLMVENFGIMHKEMSIMIENTIAMRNMLVAIMEMLELDAPKRGT